MATNNTKIDWNIMADRTKLNWENACSESFYVVYTADNITSNVISNRNTDNLGKNGMGWTIYGEWVKLIENYTSFEDVKNILSASGKENVRLLWAQNEGDLALENAVKNWL